MLDRILPNIDIYIACTLLHWCILFHIFIGYFYLFNYNVEMISSIVIHVLEDLVFLRIAIPASRLARVWKSLVFFFFLFYSPRTFEMIQTTGNRNSSSRGPWLSRTIWGQRKLGRRWLRIPVSQSERASYKSMVHIILLSCCAEITKRTSCISHSKSM